MEGTIVFCNSDNGSIVYSTLEALAGGGIQYQYFYGSIIELILAGGSEISRKTALDLGWPI